MNPKKNLEEAVKSTSAIWTLYYWNWKKAVLFKTLKAMSKNFSNLSFGSYKVNNFRKWCIIEYLLNRNTLNLSEVTRKNSFQNFDFVFKDSVCTNIVVDDTFQKMRIFYLICIRTYRTCTSRWSRRFFRIFIHTDELYVRTGTLIATYACVPFFIWMDRKIRTISPTYLRTVRISQSWVKLP